MAHVGENFWVVWIEIERPLRLGLEPLVLVPEEMHDGEPAARIGVLRIERGRRLGLAQRPLDRVRLGVQIEAVFGQIDVRQQRMGIGIFRIELDGALEKFPRPPHGHAAVMTSVKRRALSTHS